MTACIKNTLYFTVNKFRSSKKTAKTERIINLNRDRVKIRKITKASEFSMSIICNVKGKNLGGKDTMKKQKSEGVNKINQ